MGISVIRIECPTYRTEMRDKGMHNDFPGKVVR